MKASVLGRLRSHFLADGTGVGKTRQLLAMAKYLTDRGEKVVYVAPQAALKIDMKLKKITGTLGKEAKEFGVPLKIATGFDPITPGLIHVMTIEKFGKLTPDPDLVIIADEAHFMKNVMKGTARAIHGMRMMNQAKIAIFATATPIDEPQHLPFLQRIGVYEGETERDAMRKLGMIMERAPNGKGSYWKPVNERETDRRLGLLFDRLTYNGGARDAQGNPDHSQPGSITQRELGMEAKLAGGSYHPSEAPSPLGGTEGTVRVNLSSIPMPDEVWGVVQKILDGYARHPGASFDEFKGMYKARVLHAVRRAMENYKIPATVQMVKKALAEDRNVVVFLDRTNESEAGLTEVMRDRWGNVIEEVRHVFHTSEGTVPALIEALKKEGIAETDIGQIHSGKTATMQIADLKDFQAGTKKILIATIGSGAQGLDMDDQRGNRPRTMIVMTAPFSALEAIQAMGRVWRQQTQSFPEIHFLHSELDIDRWNMAIIARKLNTLGAALSGPLVKTLDLDQNPTPADLGRAGQVPMAADRIGGEGGQPTDPERVETYVRALGRAVPIANSQHHVIDSGESTHEAALREISQEPYAKALSDAFGDGFAEAQTFLSGLDQRYRTLKYLGLDVARGNRGLAADLGGPELGVHFYPFGHLLPAFHAALRAGEGQTWPAIRERIAEDMANTVIHELSRAESFEPEGNPVFDAVKRKNLRRTRQIFDRLVTRFEEALTDDHFGKFLFDGQALGHFTEEGGSTGIRQAGPANFGERKGADRGAPVGPGDHEKVQQAEGAPLSVRQRGLLEEVGRHVQDLHPDKAEWSRRMQAELPVRFHAALDGVWETINLDPAPAGRGIDEPLKDDVLANEPAAVNAIRNPFLRAALHQTSARARDPGRVDLLQRMRDFLKIPIGGSRGLIGQKRGVLGHFVHRPGKSIDLRNLGDIQTLIHEVGHYISGVVFGPQYASSPDRRAFFHKHAAALDALSQLHASPTPEEGFAEFTRLYMTNPAFVHGRALPAGVPGSPHPILALGLEFDALLKKADPEFFDFLEVWAEDYRVWRGGDLMARVRGKVAYDPATTKTSKRDTMSEIYMKIFAGGGPTERMVQDMHGGKMPTMKVTAAVAGDLLAGVNRLVDLWLFKGRDNAGGAMAYDTRRKVGMSLTEVLDPIKDKDYRDWSDYMILKRLNEMIQRNDKPAVDSRRALYTALETSPMEVSSTVVALERAHPEFKVAHDNFQKWNQHLIRYLVDAGILSKSAARTLTEMNKSYFPFNRVFETSEQARDTQARGTGGPKRLKGSGRDFVNPLEMAIRNAYLYVSLAETNAVTQKMVELTQDPKASAKSKQRGGGQYWMKRVPPQLKVMKVVPREVVEKLTADLVAIGVPETTIADFLDALNNPDVAQIVSIFRPDHARLQANEVVVYRNGKPEHFIVHPLLKQSIDHMTRAEADWLNKVYASIPAIAGARTGMKMLVEGQARLLRAGATLSPEFIGRNWFRDTFDRALYGPDYKMYIPAINSLWNLTMAFATVPRGALASLGVRMTLTGIKLDNRWRDAWIRGGGPMALASMDTQELHRKLEDILHGRTTGISPTGWILNPIHLLRALSATSEEANRLEIFRKVLTHQGATPETATKEQLQIAAHAAQTTPLDFHRMGTWMKQSGMNRASAFLNVSVQGWDKMYRELTGPDWYRRLDFMVTAITIPSLLLWLYNHDDGRWDELPQWQKDISWIIFTKKIPKAEWEALSVEERADPNIVGHVIRLPKPWQPGIIFGSIPERIADWAVGVDKDFAPMLWQSIKEMGLVNAPIPTSAQTLIALGRNYDDFTGRPIISRGMQDLAPEDQISPNTHQAAIWLAHGISTITGGMAPDSLRSPQAMDFIFYRTGGNLGRLGLDVADAAVRALEDGPPPPAGTLADIPVIRGFIARYPTSSSESIDQFYKEYTRLREIGGGARWRRKTDKDLDSYVEKHEFELAALPAATKTAKTLSDLLAQIQEIRLDPEMSPAEKRKAIDETTLERIDAAKEAVQNIRAIRRGE